MTCRPGHPERHPDFGPGNEDSVKHGADSRRRWQPIADRLEAELLAERPWWAGHRRTVVALARTEAQIELVGGWLDREGLLDGDGVPRPAVALLARLEGRAQSLRNDLGESPMAMARLLSLVTATAVTAGAADMLEGVKGDAAAFVDRYLKSVAELGPHGTTAALSTRAGNAVVESVEDRS